MANPAFSELVQSRNFVVRIKVDSAGRKGKTVTVLDGLPKFEPFLKELVKSLKQMCGAGGNYSMAEKDGLIEIQGDHRAKIAEYLARFDFKVK